MLRKEQYSNFINNKETYTPTCGKNCSRDTTYVYWYNWDTLQGNKIDLQHTRKKRELEKNNVN